MPCICKTFLFHSNCVLGPSHGCSNVVKLHDSVNLLFADYSSVMLTGDDTAELGDQSFQYIATQSLRDDSLVQSAVTACFTACHDQ